MAANIELPAPRLVERLEHPRDELDLRRARATVDQHGRRRTARDENAARARGVQLMCAGDDVPVP